MKLCAIEPPQKAQTPSRHGVLHKKRPPISSPHIGYRMREKSVFLSDFENQSIVILNKCKCPNAVRKGNAPQCGMDSAENRIFLLNEDFEM